MSMHTLKTRMVKEFKHRTQAKPAEPVVAISRLEKAFREAQKALDTAGVAVHEASPGKLAAAEKALAKAQKLFDPIFKAHEKAGG